jgi:hypothetical protein
VRGAAGDVVAHHFDDVCGHYLRANPGNVMTCGSPRTLNRSGGVAGMKWIENEVRGRDPDGARR